MKLLFFAHTPPPHHGQSYAVKLMLDSFGGNRRQAKFRHQPVNRFGIECYHVNARFSRTLEDVGEFRLGKILLVLFYCLQAIWCRFRYGVETLFYIPAPGKPMALYRDWLVMLVCRPFFKRVIFNWRAGGMAKWLETEAPMYTRSITYRRMRNVDVSIVLSDDGRRDAEKLLPKRVAVINGGIPDPCPGFESELLPRRRTRVATWKKIVGGGVSDVLDAERTVEVLYVALVSREKGAFDAVEGIALANEHFPLQFRLKIIGGFASKAEEDELRQLIRRRGMEKSVEILGFVSNERKERALRDADLFCFPTFYPAEGQPANVIEALAFGLPVVATRWRGIPGMFPGGYPGLADPRSPAQVAEALRRVATMDLAGTLRGVFLERFTIERHITDMARVFHDIETAS